MKKALASKRILLTGHTAGLIDPSNFASASDYANPAKFYAALASDQADLNFVNCVLTEEKGNRNGHYFSQALLINRHASSRLKPFNIGHNKTEIIGTMYDSAIATTDNKLIAEEDIGIHENGIPYYKGEGKLRVLVAAALYNMIGRDEVTRIVEKVKAGEDVAVSMECWFTDWDYILLDKEGQEQIVKGGEASNYLLNYVGREYNGRKVLQVFREDNFIFGGIGQVEKPACPASLILAAASLKGSTDVEGPSAFDNLSINYKSKGMEWWGSLSEEQKEQFNSLAFNADENLEGVDDMKRQKKDASGQPVVDEKGQAVYEDVPDTPVGASNSVSASELLTSIQGQARTIAEHEGTIRTLTSTVATKDGEIEKLKKDVETASADEKKRADEAEAEAKKFKVEAKVNGYLLKLARNHADLPVPSEDVLRSTFASESFDDKQFDAFVDSIKNEQKRLADASAAAEKAAVCKLFNLDPEKATEEELKTAMAKVQASVKVEGEVPEPPVNSDDNKRQAGTARDLAGASASSNFDLKNYKGGKAKITVTDSEHGSKKEFEVAVGARK